MADELHRLLVAVGIPGPYVFVGHSMGAVNVRLLASRFPTQVAGLVLLDPMTAAQETTYWPLLPDREMKAFRAGVSKLPEGIDFDLLAKGLEEAKTRTPSLQNKPVVVLTRGKEEAFPGASHDVTARMLQGWQAAQGEVLGLSSDEAHVVAERSGHFVQLDAPRLVVTSVHEVVEAIREGRALNARALSAASD
jgi:pimeloyl-ACP methyl ester carboxylesterase